VTKLFVQIAVVFLVGVLCLPAAPSADQAQYFYDPLGRLSAVIDGQGNIAVYSYDAVGNLLSITPGPVAPPTVTAISPDTVDAGASTPITISGTGLAAASVSVANPDVGIGNLVRTDTAITATLVVPNPTATGLTTVTVTTPGGVATASLTIRQPTPSIAQLTPTFGNPGATVVIDGQNFGNKPGGNRVTFAGRGGPRLVATVINESPSRITVQAPTEVTSGPVTVEVGSLTTNGVIFVGPPSLQAIAGPATQGTPANAGVASANIGQVIQLVGTGFDANTRVQFSGMTPTGAALAEFGFPFNISSDGTTASVIVPIVAVTGVVTVKHIDLQTVYPGVSLQIVPTVTGLIPPPGQVVQAGTVVTVTGSGFKFGATTVSFPGAAAPVPATAIGTNNGSLTVTVPSGATAGALTVSTDGGTSNNFFAASAQASPAVAAQGTAVNPAAASANTGQLIQLQGTGFTAATRVIFQTINAAGTPGTVTVTPVFISPDGALLSVFVPFDATTGSVAINGFGGVALQIVPTVTFINLSSGLSPGSVATISGSGFAEGATTATFPGAAGPVPADVLSGNGSLTVTIPTGATTGPVTVTTNGGTSNAFNLRNPVLTAITATAAQGTAANPSQPSANVQQQIMLTGSDFGSFTFAQFQGFDQAGVPIALTVGGTASPDGASLTVAVPFGAISGPVTVMDLVTNLGSGTVSLQVVPTVTNVTGAITPGNVVTIFGNGFEPNNTLVQFPGSATPVATNNASILSSGGTQATVTVPADAASTGPLTVTTTGGTSNGFDLGAGGGNSEIEPNDTPETATLMIIDPNTLDVTKSSRMDPAGDVDYYKFSADFSTFGTLYQVEVLPGITPGPPLNIRLTWLDQDGVTVLSTAEGPVDTGGGTVSFQLEPPSEGIYFFTVEELNSQGGSDHTYQIRLSVVPQ
jgi:YD repeat-containing protein